MFKLALAIAISRNKRGTREKKKKKETITACATELFLAMESGFRRLLFSVVCFDFRRRMSIFVMVCYGSEVVDNIFRLFVFFASFLETLA